METEKNRLLQIAAALPVVLTPTGETILRPSSAPGPLNNPLKGWCPYTDAGPITQPYSMIFLYVSWRDLEPQEGEYRFAEWEARSWNAPAAQGKHIIFRVFLDYPTLTSGLPEWLIAKGVKTTAYSDYQDGRDVVSKSVSPDYDHPALVAGLERLIAALGARYDQHPRIAFLQLGLLGFWGEWHNYPHDELFASAKTQTRVVEAYHAAFPHKKLMARNAGGHVGQQPWIGFHDDYFPEDTDGKEDWQFLNRIRKSGRAENWRRAVIGGEMIPGEADKWVGPQFERTLRMIEATHFSWVGPYCPAMKENPSAEYNSRCQKLIGRMGYQFQLDTIRHPTGIRRGSSLPIRITGKNTGVAPFYYPWSVCLALQDRGGQIVEVLPLSVDIRTWQPGAFELQAAPRLQSKPGTYRLLLGIRDPWTNRPTIAFANALPRYQGWTQLAPLVIR